MTDQFFKNLYHQPDENDIDPKRPIIAFLKNGNAVKLNYLKPENIFRNNEVCVERNDILKFIYLDDLNEIN